MDMPSELLSPVGATALDLAVARVYTHVDFETGSIAHKGTQLVETDVLLNTIDGHVIKRLFSFWRQDHYRRMAVFLSTVTTVNRLC